MMPSAERRLDFASAVGFLVFATLCGPGLLVSPLLLAALPVGQEGLAGVLMYAYGLGGGPAFVFSLACLYPIARDGYPTGKTIALGALVGTLPWLLFHLWNVRGRLAQPDADVFRGAVVMVAGGFVLNWAAGAMVAWCARKLGIFVNDPRAPQPAYDPPEPFENGAGAP
jgi:hypothetical protein